MVVEAQETCRELHALAAAAAAAVGFGTEFSTLRNLRRLLQSSWEPEAMEALVRRQLAQVPLAFLEAPRVLAHTHKSQVAAEVVVET